MASSESGTQTTIQVIQEHINTWMNRLPSRKTLQPEDSTPFGGPVNPGTFRLMKTGKIPQSKAECAGRAYLTHLTFIAVGYYKRTGSRELIELLLKPEVAAQAVANSQPVVVEKAKEEVAAA
jgi:hypothetical protein